MLTRLHIENIAVIEKVDITFDKGFTVLTGETGSGKSILIDSINLLLGNRTSKDIIRRGESKALVCAEFENLDGDSLECLAEYGIEPEDGVVIIQRNISADGRSSSRVNGISVTLTVLKEIGRRLINFHGQHENNNLLDDSYHIKYVDAFADNGKELEEYKAAYGEVKRIKKLLSSTEMDDTEKQYKLDMLTYQVNEIDNARLSLEFEDGEDEETYLNRVRSLLLNREKLVSGVEQALDAFDGDERGGVSALLEDVRYGISSAERYDESLASISDRVSELIKIADDIEAEIRQYKYDNLSESSGYSIDEVEERLDLIHRLKRKYGSSIAEILAFAEKARAELEEIEFSEERISEYNRNLEAAKKVLKEKALKLSATREKAARVIEDGVNSQLAFLEMKNAAFSCDITFTEPSENGVDRVEFLISPNKGDPMRPLSRIASGGELSRIMLSIKNILASTDSVGTLIFDEIDTGVSGRAAGKIAEKLKEMAENRQVVAVTHLPQLAALAHNHFLIEKNTDGDKTFTDVRLLDPEGRVEEVARIIGGENVSQTVKDTARELLGFNK